MTWNDVARKVLAKGMMDRDALRAMLRLADRDDFPTRYRAVYVALRNCELDGRPVAVDVVCDAVPELQDLVLDMMVNEFTSADHGYWIQRLLECAHEDRVKGAVAEVQDLLRKDERPFGAKRTEIERRMTTAFQVRDASRIITVKHALSGVVETFGPWVSFAAWDDIIGGLGEGRVHVLAGRPGRGKTTMAVQWARGATAPALFVPLEMGEQGTADIAERQGESDNLALLANPPREWLKLRQDIAWAVAETGARIVVIDHLGYIQHQAFKNQPRWDAVGHIMRDLIALMREVKCAAVLVCHLNRQPDGRKSEKPLLADLRDSGHIEQEAHSVTFLWAKRGEDLKAKGTYCLTVAKNRTGPVGGAEIIFDRPGRIFEATRTEVVE